MQFILSMLMLTYSFVFVPQSRINDCGPASMLMIARARGLGLDTSTVELQDHITGGEDRALHFTEVVHYTEDLYGVRLAITYNVADIQQASEQDPVIVLLRDRVHYVVLYQGTVFDPYGDTYDLSESFFINHDYVGFVSGDQL